MGADSLEKSLAEWLEESLMKFALKYVSCSPLVSGLVDFQCILLTDLPRIIHQ